jgi:hypothetical protein
MDSIFSENFIPMFVDKKFQKSSKFEKLLKTHLFQKFLKNTFETQFHDMFDFFALYTLDFTVSLHKFGIFKIFKY